MKILGITGGVGSGKSEVLKYMQDAYGACVCRMDDTARELQRRGTDCFEQIVRAFGVSVVNDSGELDRKKLGKTVFWRPGEAEYTKWNRTSGSHT